MRAFVPLPWDKGTLEAEQRVRGERRNSRSMVRASRTVFRCSGIRALQARVVVVETPLIPTLQVALPAASGSRSAGTSHGTRIPCSTLLPTEKGLRQCEGFIRNFRETPHSALTASIHACRLNLRRQAAKTGSRESRLHWQELTNPVLL